ncbi:MAG: hypothetical protein CVT96_07010 [Bacteroidetes bacterium HGW-Bacteroidetes-13]|jgi:hypothetical protein|nr:MAG: hypothetical protein CVT96_07010 [Bacteroidetes bacterium HGW-Bacteroidetes-13]
MIKPFRNICKKLVVEGPPAVRVCKTANPYFAKASAGTYLKYAIGKILLVVIDKTILCPVRDNLLVKRINTTSNHGVVRYGILYNVPNGTENHCNTNLLPIESP